MWPSFNFAVKDVRVVLNELKYVQIKQTLIVFAQMNNQRTYLAHTLLNLFLEKFYNEP